MDLMNINDPSVALAATAVTSNVALSGNNISYYVIVTNEGPDAAYVKAGTSGVTATAADTRILPGGIYSYRKLPEQTHIAALSSGTSALTFQYGSGE